MSLHTDTTAILGEAIDPHQDLTASDLAVAISALREAVLSLAREVDDTRLWLEQIGTLDG